MTSEMNLVSRCTLSRESSESGTTSNAADMHLMQVSASSVSASFNLLGLFDVHVQTGPVVSNFCK